LWIAATAAKAAPIALASARLAVAVPQPIGQLALRACPASAIETV